MAFIEPLIGKDGKLIHLQAKDKDTILEVCYEGLANIRDLRGADRIHLLAIECPYIKKTHYFDSEEEIPDHSTRCECGRWLIKYTGKVIN